MAYIHPPIPCFLNTLQKYRVSGNTQIYRSDDKYYTWDGLHGEIEVFNKRGYHIMVLDPYGNKIKDAVRGRKIDV